MQTQTFIRKPFDVNAVQVTLENAAEVAKWCKGKLGEADYKLMGQTVRLACVLVPGNGPKKGKMIEALVGSWVVEHNNNFRVYRANQFEQDFIQRSEPAPFFKPGDLVQDRDEYDGVWQGEVKLVDQVLVEYPMKGNMLHDRSELIHISEYSDRMKEKFRVAAENSERNEALEKINAMRAAAQEAGIDFGVDADGNVENLQGKVVETFEGPKVSEINGIRTGMNVEVTHKDNEFLGRRGLVIGLGKDTPRLLVALEGDDEIPPAVPFQYDEVRVIVPQLEAGEMIETLIEHEFDGVIIPSGTNGRVVETHEQDGPSDHNVHVMFADGHYQWFPAQVLHKI